MMIRSLFALALVMALWTGCSKQPSAPAEPTVVDLGTVDLAYNTPSTHDLEGGGVCTITVQPLNPGEIELIARVEKRGREAETARVMPARVGRPLELAFTEYRITLTPRVTR